MSDAPEVGVSSFNPGRTDVSNPIANGQPHISPSLNSEPQRMINKETQETDTNDTVGSFPLPNVIQGVKPTQGQVEPSKTTPRVSTSINAQIKANTLHQNIPGLKPQLERLSPKTMQNSSTATTSLQAKPVVEGVNSNSVPYGLLEQSSSNPSSNGPPMSSVELPYRSSASTQPSSASSGRIQPPNSSPSASHPKSVPVCSMHTTSNPVSYAPRPTYSSSGSQLGNSSSPAHSSSAHQLPPQSGPSQPQTFQNPFPPHTASGQQFPSYAPMQPVQFPSPQLSGPYPPFSSSVSSPQSSAPLPPQSFPSFPSSPSSAQSSLQPSGPTPAPNSSGHHFTPPMSQQPLPPSSNAFAAPHSSYTASQTSYPPQSHPPQNFPQPPLQTNHHHPGIPPQVPPINAFPPPNHMPRQPPPIQQHPSVMTSQSSVGSFPPPNNMPRQQPPMPQYMARPMPPPITSQPSNWAQANGIPNRLPQMDTSTRQPIPGGVPMYVQGPQEMPLGLQQPPAMTSNVQQQMANDALQQSRRYPQQQAGYQQYPSGTSVGNSNSVERISSQFRGLSVTRDGFNKLWGADCYDLLQTRNILPSERVEAPKIQLHQEYLDGVNCRPEIFRCTLTKIPETNSLLQKSRLPLGILIHPFKDINNLPVVQCNTIVRCRACRTYINPFVYFVDHRRWKCNLCFRVNDMPEEFQFDPVTKTYGDPSRRPEIRSSTIEYIAPSEYMLRPPQAAVYLFLLDVSCGALELGYLNIVCDVLSEELSQLPGDTRTQIGFIAFDSALHFFSLAEGLTQPQHLVVSDTNEVFLPRPDNLLVNLQECKDLVLDLLAQLPTTFLNSHDTGSALGPALQAAFKLMGPTGGRVTVFQTCLPSVGPGALKVRGNDGGAKEAPAQHLNPATDFYKRLALDCSGKQVAVDLFVLGTQYTDLATLSGVSQFSGGYIYHLPRFDGLNNFEASMLERCFHRYLSRKIGFEAVMRIRCSRGLSIHTFHGHFFVRSTDLLSLPNVNPDAGFGMQVAIDESLADMQNICFQAALLYTSSKGERRIRVHTLCLPIAANVNDIVCAADQQCIVGLLAKMAVDRSHQSSPADARDAFINVATDVLSTYRLSQSVGPSSGLLAPHSLRLLPLYILALLKHVAFRSGQGTRLDDRVFAMCQMKTLPLSLLMQEIYPDLYPVHTLNEQTSFKNAEGQYVPNPPRLHLSAEKLDSRGVFLLDKGDTILIYVGRSVAPQFCQDVFGVPHFAAIQDDMYELPLLSNPVSESLNNFVRHLQSEKPFEATIQIIREDSRHRMHFIEKLVEDRSESALSYYEFLQHLKAQIK